MRRTQATIRKARDIGRSSRGDGGSADALAPSQNERSTMSEGQARCRHARCSPNFHRGSATRRIQGQSGTNRRGSGGGSRSRENHCDFGRWRTQYVTCRWKSSAKTSERSGSAAPSSRAGGARFGPKPAIPTFEEPAGSVVAGSEVLSEHAICNPTWFDRSIRTTGSVIAARPPAAVRGTTLFLFSQCIRSPRRSLHTNGGLPRPLPGNR